MADLEIVSIPIGKNGTFTLTAKVDGEPLIDTLNITKAKARDEFRNRLVERWQDLPPAKIDAELNRLAAEHVERASCGGVEADKAEPSSGPDSDELLKAMPPEIVAEAEAMLADPDLVRRVILDIAALGVAGEHELAATSYLIGTSRLLDRPLSGIVQGLSSSGKSYLVGKVAGCFPNESIILATQMTPQALYHLPPGSLVHCFIVAGERSRMDNDETAETTRALRQMISEGRLTKLLPEKIDGRIQTQEIVQDGPVAFVETTTLTKIFNEDLTRCLLLQTDEQSDQTRRIMRTVAKAHSGGSGPADPDAILERHHALQRLLKRCPVVVPYAERLAEAFNDSRVEARRAFGQVLSMVEAIALLHQRQRQTDADGRLLATADDYALARRLLDKPMARLLGGRITDAARRFWDRLRKWAVPGEPFSRRDVAKHGEKVQDRTINGWLSELHDAGFVELVEPSHAQRPATWRLSADAPAESAAADLPTVDEVCGGTFPHSGRTQVVAGAVVA